MSAESVSDLKTAKFGIQKTRTSQYVFEYKNVWDPVKKTVQAAVSNFRREKSSAVRLSSKTNTFTCIPR